jgi:(S)-ureidoglycine aminohydrolase
MTQAPSDLFGHTRAHVGARHALLTPANHVGSVVPGITGATAVIQINEAMGARFAQVLVTFQKGGAAAAPANEVETFGFLLGGSATVLLGGQRERCGPGGFFFAPARQTWSLSAPTAGAQLLLFQKKYVPLAGVAGPRPLIGDAARVKGVPFLGDPAANLQVLLPDEPAYDLAVNVFAYQPGGHLPFVEAHVMEHGLLMLDGEGVYRLEDSWYPVRAGDAIWMAPFCPQWFVAMGKKPASYLYYKDVNRPAL